MSRRIIILTEGHTEPHAGKTAASVIRYRGQEVAALLDATQAGRTSGELLGVGDVPRAGLTNGKQSAVVLRVTFRVALSDVSDVPPSMRSVRSIAAFLSILEAAITGRLQAFSVRRLRRNCRADRLPPTAASASINQRTGHA